MDMSLTGVGSLVGAFDEMADLYTPSGEGWVVGTNVPYSVHQEYGTYKMSGTPHVRPGVDATRRQMASLAVRATSMDDFLRLTAFKLTNEIQERAPVESGNLQGSYAPPEKL